ncbi:MAG: chloride channel protein [Archangiaceae bacterium]|nr:chloride channel protein [Archangiaceae bacterium]
MTDSPRATLSVATLRFAAGLLAVAVAAAAFAVVFRVALSGVLRLAAGQHDVVSAMRALPWWARLALPPAGALVAGTLAMLAARGRPSQGVGDVMEAVVVGRTRLSMRVTLLKSLGSWVAIACGGSIGREGPLIQFGGASGQWLADRLGLKARPTRVLIAAGIAAGFAAAYNTPFAAVLFVCEVVSGLAVLELLLPALLATAVSTLLTRAAAGEGPIYGSRAFAMRSPFELAAFAALGVLCAVAAVGFMLLLARGEKLFHHPRLRMPWRTALGGLVAGCIVAVLPEVAGNGYEPLNAVLDGRLVWSFVLLVVLSKCVATTACVGSGTPGGVFTPTLLLGGGLGYVAGVGLHAVFGEAVGPAGGYALVGMAATLAATTHAPLLAAVMAFELSGDYAEVLPLVIAAALAAGVARALRTDSLYTAELKNRGVEWELTLDGRRQVK